MALTADHVCTLPARMDRLPDAIAFVEEFCRERQAARNDVLRLSLVVEELFTNTVMHGHGGDSDAPVRIGLGGDRMHFDLTYEDTAPPFDPLDRGLPSTTDPDDLSKRPVGHFGLGLVVSMAARASYAREQDRNCLSLILRREAHGDADA